MFIALSVRVAALQSIRETGDPIPWIDLFLQKAATMGTPNALALVDLICENPVVTSRSIEDRLDVSRPTALRLLRRMAEQGVLTEADSGARGQRRYVARAMMEVVATGSAHG